MTTLSLALALLGSADAANDAADTSIPTIGFEIEDTRARNPSSRPSAPAARPSSGGGSRPSAPPASRPSSSSRPSAPPPSSRPSTGAPRSGSVQPVPSGPTTRPPPSARPGPPPVNRPPGATTRPPSARPPTSTTRPPTSTTRPPSHRPPTGTARPPTAPRPGYAPARPPAYGRPGPAYAPARPYYGGNPYVAHRYYGPRYYVRPYSGVFVYGPRPVYHRTYYVNGGRPAQAVAVRERHMPDRAIDRANSLAVGLKGGSYISGYSGANAFADAGLGLTVRYRPVEWLGIEGAAQHHLSSERAHTLGSASVNLFAFPWSRVSPYVLAGATFTDRNVVDEVWRQNQVQTIVTSAPMIGPHAGLGLEIAIGKRLALDLEARYIGYVNPIPADPTVPGALTTSVGVLWHF